MKDVLELISGHLDHILTPDEAAELGDWIKADPANARQFTREVFVHSRMRDMLVGEQYLRNQNQPAPSHSSVASSARKKPVTQTTPFSKRRFVSYGPWLAAASVLLAMSLLVPAWRHWGAERMPPAPALTKAVNAEWEGPAPDVEKPLALGMPLHLKAGCVDISLAGSGNMIVEGPATFTLQSPRAISLEHGKLTARMPGGGLVIDTSTAHITDLGTEFGVSTDADETRVEVFQGKVQTAPATNATLAITLVSGQAATVAAGHVTVDPGGAIPQRFVRTLARDVTQLDVVDLVAGGDGTGHHRGVGIDMRTGAWGTLPAVGEVAPDGQYHRVPALPVVDGVFIPDSARGAQTVDSAGDQFPLPTSYHGSFMPLWAGGAIPFPPPGNAPISSTLAGINYSLNGHGLLEMHSNKGLTLDLAAIRRLHPGQSITGFVSVVGNTKITPDNAPSAASAYVLVDGQVRFSREAFTGRDGAVPVNLRVQEMNRFLTLVVTDGGDSTITFDHVIWGDPLLELSAPMK